MVHHLSRRDGRRIAVRAQLLDGPRPTDALAVLRRLTLVQFDLTAHVAPSPDIVFWSRLGRAYSLGDLDGPLERLRSDGPLPTRALPDTCVVPWRSSGWNDDRNVRMLVAMLEARGEVAVAERAGRERLWDLAERVYPDTPTVALLAEVFESDYQLEMYKPAAKRRWVMGDARAPRRPPRRQARRDDRPRGTGAARQRAPLGPHPHHDHGGCRAPRDPQPGGLAEVDLVGLGPA